MINTVLSSMSALCRSSFMLADKSTNSSFGFGYSDSICSSLTVSTTVVETKLLSGKLLTPLCFIGIKTPKVLPLLSWLSKYTSPFNKWANCFEMYKPRPVPPYFLLVELSACWKLWNSFFLLSSDIPIPLSFISIAKISWLANEASSGLVNSQFSLGVSKVMATVPPFGVNFKALDKKFFKICSTLPTSVNISLGQLSVMVVLNWISFLFICGLKSPSMSENIRSETVFSG